MSWFSNIWSFRTPDPPKLPAPKQQKAYNCTLVAVREGRTWETRNCDDSALLSELLSIAAVQARPILGGVTYNQFIDGSCLQPDCDGYAPVDWKDNTPFGFARCEKCNTQFALRVEEACDKPILRVV